MLPPHPPRRRLAFPYTLTALLVAILFAGWVVAPESAATTATTANTATVPSQPAPLSPAAQRYLVNLHIVNKCDASTYQGRSPDRAICWSLLRAFQRQGALRRWAAYPSTLKLLRVESGYAHRALNPSSGACGLGQMLPCGKYGAGTCWPTLNEQATCFVRYVLGRYHTPGAAWRYWTNHHWY